MDSLVYVVLAIVVIAVTTAVAPRLGLAGPLLLVLIGIGVGLLPFVPAIEVEPDVILVGVLPPLLYSAAVALPALEFRRDFGPIAGLSVVLVLVSSIALAALFVATIPGLSPYLAVALGAILSPTDAVATSIVKRLGISRRVVTLLEGESLLNDATALVLLRTMIAAAALTASGTTSSAAIQIGFIPAFLWGVIVAVVVGALVGYLNLRLRALMSHSAANTAVGFVVPFVAFLPTEALGGSGLVAAVVAGIVTGQGAARWFTPEQRLSDVLNWRTIELVLEGAVFLLMGLELREIVAQNLKEQNGLGTGIGLALAALAIIIVVRAGYVALLVWLQSRRARNTQRRRLETLSARLDEVAAGERAPAPAIRGRTRGNRDDERRLQRRLDAMRTRVSRALSDLDYYQASPLGWKHGTVIVWAGMRGVVTLAAAQTLPRTATERPLLIFVAFCVAVGSLMLQGFTLPWLVRRLRLERATDDQLDRVEQSSLDGELRDAAESALADSALVRRDGTPFPSELVQLVGSRYSEPPDEDRSIAFRDGLELRLVLIEAMRKRLNELSSGGAYSTAALRHALAELDADQLSLQLRIDDQS
ncbi:sodium:proton antiporter [Microbacterium deminutum]|uniref:Sodium:proton antiporter n=1 Tax=Microbacterium deminutum TaxID=344164 RepID=A0ABN2QKN0_9MICO